MRTLLSCYPFFVILYIIPQNCRFVKSRFPHTVPRARCSPQGRLLRCSCRFAGRGCPMLSGLHPSPADKTVQVVDQKHAKADNHREIGDVRGCCQAPQHNQHGVVCGIGQCKIGAAAEGQVYGQKAGGYRYGAGNQIGRVERPEDPLKREGHDGRQRRHKRKLPRPQRVDLNLRPVALKRVTEP